MSTAPCIQLTMVKCSTSSISCRIPLRSDIVHLKDCRFHSATSVSYFSFRLECSAATCIQTWFRKLRAICAAIALRSVREAANCMPEQLPAKTAEDEASAKGEGVQRARGPQNPNSFSDISHALSCCHFSHVIIMFADHLSGN